MSDEIDDRIKLVCKLSWPAHGPGPNRFQRTIVRSAHPDGTTVYQMPEFNVSLLRNPDEFRAFCRAHLSEMRTQIQVPWEFWFEVVYPDDSRALRRFVPPDALVGSKFGPFLANQLMAAQDYMRMIADSLWTVGFQTWEVVNLRLMIETAMTRDALFQSYQWLWGTKDKPGPDLKAVNDGSKIGYIEGVDAHLSTGYTRLARKMLRQGDIEAAAQYAQVAFDLSPTEDLAKELALEFSQVRERWAQLAAVKNNALKKVATVAREGLAWWASSLWDELYREGRIKPITDQMERSFASGEAEAERQRIRGLSATHPYRRGLELMDTIESNLGFTTAMLTDLITEWPWRQIMWRVPASSVVKEIRRGSSWAPDTRLEKLAKLSRADIREVPFTGEVMPYLHTIHTHLDDDLPGIMTYALEQLPDS